MDARDEILSRLRQQERKDTAGHVSPTPPAWRTRRHFDDLAGRFSEALTAAKGEARRARSFAEALDQMGEVFGQLKAQRVVANNEPPLTGVDLATRWPQMAWHLVPAAADLPAGQGPAYGELRDFCAAADVGLSGADAALAETGSIILSSGPGNSRLATLLPAVHLALVPVSRLTTDIFTWTAARQGPPPANITLVSGPSRTADIEQTMTTGVHGPKRFIVILYDDP
jgi:L-lactate utilization protein LutC